jgi:hypothetical protein
LWGVPEGFPGDEDEDTADEQDGPKAAEEIAHDFLEHARGGAGGYVAAVLDEEAFSLGIGETLDGGGGETMEKLIGGDNVPFEACKL